MMRSLISTFVLSSILMVSIFSVTFALKKVNKEAKPEKLKLLPEVQQSNGFIWRYSLNTSIAFLKKKGDAYTGSEIPTPFFENFVTTNGYTNIRCLGLTQLSHDTLMAVLLASKNKKDDTCIFVKFAPKGHKYSLSPITVNMKITKIKVTNERRKDILGLILYQEDQENGYKTHIIFDAKNGVPIMEKKLKTWLLQK